MKTTGGDTDRTDYKWSATKTTASQAWRGVGSLRRHIKYGTVGQKCSYTSLAASDYSQLRKGDVVFKLKEGYTSRNDDVTHVGIVDYVSGSSISTYEHSPKDHRVWPFSKAETVMYQLHSCEVTSGGSTSGFPSDVNQSSKKTGYIATSTDPLTIRSGPGTGYGSVGTAAKGSTVDYYTTSLSTAWYYVVQGSLKGYGSAQYILPSSGGSTGPVGKMGTVNVNSAGLNIRTSPNGSLASYKLYNGHRIKVLEVATAAGYTWYRLQDESGRTANWGRSDFIILD